MASYASDSPELVTLDANDNYRVKQTVPLPDRVTYTIFSPGMALSADEQYLYYLKRTDCFPGPLCDNWSIGIVDLDAGREVAHALLPQNFGFALLTPLRQRDMLVMSPTSGRLYESTSTGETKLVAEFLDPPDATISDSTWPVFAGWTETYGYYMIFQEGAFEYRDASGKPTLRGKLFESRRFALNGIHRWRLDGRWSILGFDSQRGDTLRAAIIFDAIAPAASTYVPLPERTRYLAPMPGGTVAVLHDETVSMLDLSSRTLSTRSLKAPPESRWLVTS